MSNLRQEISTADPVVRGYSVTHPPGTVALSIEPGWDQLLYAATGAMTISTGDRSWMIPLHRALWIPGNQRATVSNRSRVAVRGLYLASSLRALPAAMRAMNVSGFGRELLLHVVRCCPLDHADPVHDALLALLINQLREFPEAPLWLPQPADPRAVDFAAAATADATAGAAALARRVGASRRTLERLFATETGLSLGAWRRRARILNSLASLAEGASVTGTALSAGYTTPSAYITAFKRELGITPKQFLRH
jgi:AraC-like DNA-binding protein